MKHRTLLSIVAALFTAVALLAADPEQDAIRLAQEWAFALGKSVKSQAEAGSKDPKAIRKKAIEDTQPEEKKLRAAMKEVGMTQKEIEQGIKQDRDLYLSEFLKEFLKK
jgi:hypothetical protein